MGCVSLSRSSRPNLWFWWIVENAHDIEPRDRRYCSWSIACIAGDFSDGDSLQVNFDLYRWGDHITYLGSLYFETDGHGTANWTIEQSYNSGSGYKMRVSLTENDNVYDESDEYFSILEQTNTCDDISCDDYCSGNTRYYDGYCGAYGSGLDCFYDRSEYCTYGCQNGQCSALPDVGITSVSASTNYIFEGSYIDISYDLYNYGSYAIDIDDITVSYYISTSSASYTSGVSLGTASFGGNIATGSSSWIESDVWTPYSFSSGWHYLWVVLNYSDSNSSNNSSNTSVYIY